MCSVCKGNRYNVHAIDQLVLASSKPNGRSIRYLLYLFSMDYGHTYNDNNIKR